MFTILARMYVWMRPDSRDSRATIGSRSDHASGIKRQNVADLFDARAVGAVGSIDDGLDAVELFERRMVGEVKPGDLVRVQSLIKMRGIAEHLE
jgi:hypothetical protein